MSLQPVLLTVNGTADTWDGFGFAAQVGRAMALNGWEVVSNKLDGLAPPTAPYFWQGVGYAAATFPMGPSVDGGVTELIRLVNLLPLGTPLAFSSYSQGAMVVCKAWRDQILSPTGRLHDRLNDVVGIVNFGDPMRCPGIANGNAQAGLPAPSLLDGQVTGGIAGPGCLTADQTPDFLLSCALDGDLYASAPVGVNPWTNEPDVGADETVIYDLVQNFNWASITELTHRVVSIIEKPFTEVFAMVEAIINGLTFAAAGPDAAHYHYEGFVPAMVDWLIERVNQSSQAA